VCDIIQFSQFNSPFSKQQVRPSLCQSAPGDQNSTADFGHNKQSLPQQTMALDVRFHRKTNTVKLVQLFKPPNIDPLPHQHHEINKLAAKTHSSHNGHCHFLRPTQ